MLAYFPTPYPDELWYSVLSRYHLRSGNGTHATTRYELFGNERRIPSVLAVNPNFYDIFDVLPPELLDKRQVITEHTIIPYLLRFTAAKRRKETISCLLGTSSDIGNKVNALRQWARGREERLRYCPICADEDAQMYGEAYWHRSHQITLMTICPHHHCRLAESDIILDGRTGERFHCMTRRHCPPIEPASPCFSWEIPLSDTLMAMLASELPEEVSPKEWASTLFTAAQNAGIFSATSNKVYPMQLRSAVMNLYGEELCNIYFPTDTISANVPRMMRSGVFSFPEQYALVSVLLELPPAALSTGQTEADEMSIKMKKMADSGYLWKKLAVAKRLGVESSQLMSMARQRGIVPFWLFGDGSNSLRQDDRSLVCVKTVMTAEMKAMIQERVEELGIANIAEYIRYCIKKDLTQ